MSKFFWIVFVLIGAIPAAAQDESFDARCKKNRANFHRSLQNLAKSCEKQKLDREATIVRNWIIARDPKRQYAFQPQPRDSIAEANEPADWLNQFTQLRIDQASSLFTLASEAVSQKKSAGAFALLHEVLHENPNHAEARKILGFRLDRDSGWYRPSREITDKKSLSKHRLMNWPARSYSIVESAHYRVATRADIETTKDMVKHLEVWHELWKQVFFDYWANDAMIAKWFAGSSSYRPKSRKYKVVFFENQDAYVNELSGLGIKNVERSTGYYNDKKATCFFYAGDETLRQTWLQEQAHQLFQESVATVKDPTRDGNMWAAEGIAMYFESMVEHPRYSVFGGFDTQRLQFARIRINRQASYMPFEQLERIGGNEFQNHRNVRALYSQSAGLAQFFMTTDNGRYRKAFVEFVLKVYKRRARPSSLEKLTGLTTTGIDSAFKASLELTANDISQLGKMPPMMRELALGDSPITSKDLKDLAKYQSLQWLQLSKSKIDDEVLTQVQKLGQLKQLFLDSTAITDAGAAKLSGLDQLQELDLASTRITDESLRTIGKLTNLQVLWLSNTGISDAGLGHLHGLSKLEMIDVAGTRVSEAALKSLKQRLPKLK